MKATYKVSDNLSFEIETEKQSSLFAEIAKIQEVFSEPCCGKCKKTNLQYRVRENDGNLFYELRCRDCQAKLHFGVKKVGGEIFPKRKGADGEWVVDSGWLKWNKNTQQEE